jgi:hypothetical protein
MMGFATRGTERGAFEGQKKTSLCISFHPLNSSISLKSVISPSCESHALPEAAVAKNDERIAMP